MLFCQTFNDSVQCLACNLDKKGHSMFLRGHDISFGCLPGAYIMMSPNRDFQVCHLVMGRQDFTMELQSLALGA